MLSPVNNVNRFKWECYATRYVFLMLGIAFSIWATLIPYAKERLVISEFDLGNLLLLVGAGALLSMPWAGGVTNRLGCRKALMISSTVFLLSLIALACFSNILLFGLGLLLFGISSGVIDVAMNMHAAIVEEHQQRKLMSGFHAMYSLGGFFGGLVVSVILEAGVASFSATAILSILMLVGLFAVFLRHILPYGSQGKNNNSFSRPSGMVLFMAILCFFFYMCDGIVLDWGALLMKHKGSSLEFSGLAFSLFSLAIATGRLRGDWMAEKLGTRKTLLISAIVTGSGYCLILSSASTFLSLIGFAIIGLGVSNLIPILFSYAVRQKTMPISQAISFITTLGYLGLMAGPPAMGFIAEQYGVLSVFMSVAGLILAGTLSAIKYLR